MPSQTFHTRLLNSLLALAVALNVLFWFYSKNIKSEWINVPPVPSKITAVFPALGDEQFASRITSIIIQNLGSTGGRVTPIKDYDFEALGKWLMLSYSLDPHSNLVPYMSAHYFSASQDPTKIKPVVDYLRVVGNSIEGEKWRWLAQAVYLARFKLNDLDLALDMAEELAQLNKPDMPAWAKQMDAIVLNARGEKEASLEILLRMLKDSADKLDPAEVTNTKYFICEQILDVDEALQNPLCDGIIEQ